MNYRGDGVDVGWTNGDGGSAYVGWTHAGEWMGYTINAATAGSYTLNARDAAAAAGGSFHIEIDGTNVSGTMTVPNTGSWDAYQTVSKSGVYVTAGQHVMKVVMDTNDGVGFTGNFNWFTFAAGAATATPTAVAGTVPAAPSAMTLVGAAKWGLSFNFFDNANNETTYTVERLDGTGNYKALASITADTAGTGWRNWTDWGINAGTTYYYRVKASNASGDSGYAYATGTTSW